MMFPRTTKPIRIFYFACLAVVLFCLIIWLSAAATIGLMNLAQYIDGTIGTYLIDKGAARLMRRALLVGIILILVITMKKTGWRGWKDCGWTQDEGLPNRRWINLFQGIAIGFITLGSIATLTILTGLHKLNVLPGNNLQLIGNLLLFAVSGLLVALIEETICRGILFRVFARAWNSWTAALITSILFASAHFIGPGETAFQGNSFLAISLNVTAATCAGILPPLHDLIRFINLALLGIVLCGFVIRTKTIWMSVGAHAAWVAIIKFHSCFTNLNPEILPSIWLGKRNDFMDSLGATFIFIVLILLTLRGNKKTGSPVKIRGQIWHIKPAANGQLDNFLKAGEDLFASGIILKSYQGCRVVARDGLVLKKYWPKYWWDSLRFAFRPPRGRRVFLLADALIERGLPTPPVLAWSARRRLGLLLSEAMIVSEIKNAEPLTSWLERKTGDAGERLKVMEAYGNLMAAFHRHGYSNRDLKHENVMCLKNDPALIQVVDLDGVRNYLLITRRRAGRDLMRIGKSLASLGWTDKTEIAAFFEAYNSQVPARLQRHSFPEQ